MTDPILALARDHVAVDTRPLVDFGLKFSGVLASTPPDRIERAVGDEIADLVRRARAALDDLGLRTPDANEARAALTSDAAFPRERLADIARRARTAEGGAELADELERWVARHQALEKRVNWLLNGTPPDRRALLDPHDDADQLHHVLTSGFRFEARVVETLAINRVAQSAVIGTFFRSTGEAETNAVMRFFDTYALYGNVFEWGVDSYRGRAAIERMNQIHGRYYIPNDEIKFVLLQGAFTWLDGVDRIGHRPVTDSERRGMLASWARMGRAMHIDELSEDYEEMYGWYRAVCEATAEHAPFKRDTFEVIVKASMSGQLPQLKKGLFLAARVAMDDTYRSSLGYPDPSPQEVQAVRAVFFTVGSFVEQLPSAPYLRSLMNSPARRDWTDPLELGVSRRSGRMPTARADRPNAGFPEWQVPIRSPDAGDPMELPELDWESVRRLAEEGRLCVVVDGYVLDVTVMRDVHPGGAAILERWAGKDATTAFRTADHSNGARTFALNYRIGRLASDASGDADDVAENAAAAVGD